LPRDLGDVLHFFLGDEDGAPHAPRAGDGGGPPRADRLAALPIVSIPVGERDVVRAAYAWNLAVEVARQGASATLLAPVQGDATALWPEAGRGPLGVEVALSSARNFGDLNRAALDIAVGRAADSGDGGVVLTTVPPAWYRDAATGRALIRWVLLFAAAEASDLLETYGLAKRVIGANPEARVGVTIHGVRRVAEAEQAFRRVSDVAARRLDHPLESYGLLVDDLHVYRAIVSRRPIGLEHPQSRAARALRDVASLLLEDARSRAVV
jgi:hypothetical protein